MEQKQSMAEDEKDATLGRILLVDDNPTNLQVLFQTLGGMGHTLLIAKSGEQALNIARKAQPELMLLDIMMPGMDGYEVCANLKSDPETAGVAVIFLSALGETENKVQGLRLGAVDYISKPFQPEEVVARVGTHMKVIQLERSLSGANASLQELNDHLEQKVRDRTEQLMRGRDAVIFGLARLAEARDNETGKHLDRMSRYAEMLALQFVNGNPGMNENWVSIVRTTSILHDIGKIGVPDAILHKPGPLDPDERVVMDRHASIGGDALRKIQDHWGDDPFLRTAMEIACGHHEKWDGSGYPQGLTGEAIPLSARIVSLADVYDALRSKRVYKEGWSHVRARDAIVDGAGTQFDPDVVAAFLMIESDFERVAMELAG
ncbi:MAG: response regulator [Pseudomonadota bacterium]|nr:response regulator [Pseudomonadota bacterium]